MLGMLNNPFLHLGLGMLSQAGPSPQPTGLGAVGRGGLLGMQSYQQQQEADIANRLSQVKLAQATGALPVPQESTSLMRNVAAVMSLPEGDPARQFMEDIMLKPQVSINQRPTPPAGYRYTPDGSLEPVPGGPATKPSESEAKQRIQAEIGLRLLEEVDTLVSKGVPIGGGAFAKAAAASSPILSWAVDLTPGEAKVASNLEQFSNIMLAAMRGAQVGPAEQARFEKQLPRLGQDKALFEANMRASKQNLQKLISRMAELRSGTAPIYGTPTPPPGFIPLPP